MISFLHFDDFLWEMQITVDRPSFSMPVVALAGGRIEALPIFMLNFISLSTGLSFVHTARNKNDKISSIGSSGQFLGQTQLNLFYPF